jgi:hypothetical protein
MWEIAAKLACIQVECESPRYGSGTVVTQYLTKFDEGVKRR